MSIELATKYLPYVDEIFKNESKLSSLTNQNFNWTGAHTVAVYTVGTSGMNDYGRSGPADGNWSRYGAINDLSATTQKLTVTKDRSFTFAIDTLDNSETEGSVAAATALARQVREVVVPEIDSWVYGKMCTGAGTQPTALSLTSTNIFTAITDGTKALDNSEVPDTERVLVVTPDVYLLMKRCKDIVMETDIGSQQRMRGVIAYLDGMSVVRVPAVRVPENFGFMIAHPSATVAPTKLESYRIHADPPGISGSLIEGRIVYDAFVLDNKSDGIYYQATAAAASS